jgi:hypothetical protein
MAKRNGQMRLCAVTPSLISRSCFRLGVYASTRHVQEDWASSVHAREARKVADTLPERRGGRQSAVTAAPALSIAESLPVRASHLVAQAVRESDLARNHLGYLLSGRYERLDDNTNYAQKPPT